MPRYYDPWDYGPSPGWGRGFGFRRGYGRGWCYGPWRPWCWGWGGWGPPPGPNPYWFEPPYEGPQEEIEDLKEEEAYLRGELEAIQQRLAELQKEASSQ
jgi:hypothetical protein